MINRDQGLDLVREMAHELYRRLTVVMGSDWYRPFVDGALSGYGSPLAIPKAGTLILSEDHSGWELLNEDGSVTTENVTIGWPNLKPRLMAYPSNSDWIHQIANFAKHIAIYYMWPGTYGPLWHESYRPFPFFLYGAGHTGNPYSFPDPYADFEFSPFTEPDGTYVEDMSRETIQLVRYLECRIEAVQYTLDCLHTCGGTLKEAGASWTYRWQDLIHANPSATGTIVCQNLLDETVHYHVWAKTGEGPLLEVADVIAETYDTGIAMEDSYERYVCIYITLLDD
jgi:hypothetical protein